MKSKYPVSNFPVSRCKTWLHIVAKRRTEIMRVPQCPPFAAVHGVEDISLGCFVLRETQRISQAPCEEMNTRGATSHLVPAPLMGEVPPLRRFFDSWFSGPAERRKVTVAREEEDHTPILLGDEEETMSAVTGSIIGTRKMEANRCSTNACYCMLAVEIAFLQLFTLCSNHMWFLQQRYITPLWQLDHIVEARHDNRRKWEKQSLHSSCHR